MFSNRKINRPNTQLKASNKRLEKIRRRQWKKRIKVRAEKVKRQVQAELKFHQAMREMKTTSDRYRQSYLHWVLSQMFTLFDYESGLRAINDKAAYRSWLSLNTPQSKTRSRP
ncbi:MAG: hypothetical protein KJN89_08115 [Gammaproteobacteria bacterium]|nr:hypothetical protein [Gammaproteobacteria bacterium]NNJ50327.1 hypothetical protein [Gammaproteobacteria bacterium]